MRIQWLRSANYRRRYEVQADAIPSEDFDELGAGIGMQRRNTSHCLVAGSSPGNQLHGSRRTRNDAGQCIHTGTLAASTLLFLFALEIAVFGYLPGAQEQRAARRKAVLKGADLMTTPITAMSRRLNE